jgi:hypothetical protein
MTDELKPDLRHELPTSWARERRGPLVAELRRSARARSHRRWRRGLIVVPAMAVLAAGATAGVVALTGDTPEIQAAGCYPRADRDATPTAYAQDADADPVASCREEWRAGHVAPTTAVPPLVACVSTRAAGVGETEARVYPGRGNEVCERLDMKPLPAHFSDQARKSSEFRERMAQRLAGCPPVARAKQIAREELDRAGRTSWEVRVRPDQGDVARTDCIDTYGTVQVEGEPSRVELDYPVEGLSEAEARREEERMRQAGCDDGKEQTADGALAATECRYPLLSGCIRPRRAAAELRRQLAMRDLTEQVRVDFDAPDRCWSGFTNDGGTITLHSQARP